MNPKLNTTFALLILALVFALPAQAGELSVPSAPAQVPPLPPAVDGSLTLDLSAAYQLALSRNLDIQVGRYNLASAGTGIITNSGIFDPTLDFGIDGDYTDSPTTTQLAGTERRSTSFGLGIGQLLPTGGQVSLEAGSRRSADNSPWVTIDPAWGTDVTARFSQPLLDGFGTLVNRSGIVIAKNNRNQSAVGFEIQVITTLRNLERAYWDFINAREKVTVDQQSLDLAQRLLDETGERVKVGTSAPIDLVQSEATVATRRQDLIVSRNAAANAQDNLKAAIGFDSPAEWLLEIKATESYQTDPLEVDLAEAINTAHEHRPEIHQQEINIETGELYVKLARNKVLPDLNFTASYGYSGVDGDRYYIDEETGERIQISSGGWSDSVSQIGDFPHWTLGINLSMPLGNNDAEGLLAQRRYELERAKVELAALKQQIILEVRTAVRAMHDGAAAIDAAVASTELARRNLEAEYTKFNNGLSTNYLVLDIQEKLAQAQLSELNARIVYRKATAAYHSSTGTLLHRLGVSIIDPGAPESPHTFLKDVQWLRFVDFKRSSLDGDHEEETADNDG